jgi:hypothetical protein
MRRKPNKPLLPVFDQLVVGGRLNFTLRAPQGLDQGLKVNRQLTMPGLKVETSFTVDSENQLDALLKNDEFYAAHPVFFSMLSKEALKYL